MSTNKTIILLWVGGWVAIGLPVVAITALTIGEWFENFIYFSLFFGTIFVLGEVRAYIKKKANGD